MSVNVQIIPATFLAELFLCYLWWTYCDGLYYHTVYIHRGPWSI